MLFAIVDFLSHSWWCTFNYLQLISGTLLVSSTLLKTGAYDWLRCLPRTLLSMLWTNYWVKLCQEHSLSTRILAPWPQKLRQEVGVRSTSELYTVLLNLDTLCILPQVLRYHFTHVHMAGNVFGLSVLNIQPDQNTKESCKFLGLHAEPTDCTALRRATAGPVISWLVC